MDDPTRRLIGFAVFFLALPLSAQSLQFSGGADGRFTRRDGNAKGVLEGLFLNARHVIQDRSGDRLILVGQLDIDDNFEQWRSYQTYAQYKGPLGRWNVRGGHYILPFGLLSEHDSERLLLKTLEDESLGIKLDTGLEALGFLDSFTYALSVSQGVGRRRLRDVDDNKLLTGRLGWTGDAVKAGFSWLKGRVLQTEELFTDKIVREEGRWALDATAEWGQFILRSELIVGEDDGKSVGGGFLGVDRALNPRLELNFKYAHWQRKGPTHWAGAGFSYMLAQGLYFRLADEQRFSKEDKNGFSGQIYYEFSKTIF